MGNLLSRKEGNILMSSTLPIKVSFVKLWPHLSKMLILRLNLRGKHSMMENGGKWMIIKEGKLSINLLTLFNKMRNGLHTSKLSTTENPCQLQQTKMFHFQLRFTDTLLVRQTK